MFLIYLLYVRLHAPAVSRVLSAMSTYLLILISSNWMSKVFCILFYDWYAIWLETVSNNNENLESLT